MDLSLRLLRHRHSHCCLASEYSGDQLEAATRRTHVCLVDLRSTGTSGSDYQRTVHATRSNVAILHPRYGQYDWTGGIVTRREVLGGAQPEFQQPATRHVDSRNIGYVRGKDSRDAVAASVTAIDTHYDSWKVLEHHNTPSRVIPGCPVLHSVYCGSTTRFPKVAMALPASGVENDVLVRSRNLYWINRSRVSLSASVAYKHNVIHKPRTSALRVISVDRCLSGSGPPSTSLTGFQISL